MKCVNKNFSMLSHPTLQHLYLKGRRGGGESTVCGSETLKMYPPCSISKTQSMNN